MDHTLYSTVLSRGIVPRVSSRVWLGHECTAGPVVIVIRVFPVGITPQVSNWSWSGCQV